MDSCELVTLISSIACMIAKSHTCEEVELLAAILSQLGDTLATISTHQELCGSKSAESTDTAT